MFCNHQNTLNKGDCNLGPTQAKQEIKVAVTYKWPWASALESRDQVPSALPHFRGQSRGSAAKKEWTTNVLFAGLLALQIVVFCNFTFSYMPSHKPANNQQ